MGNPGFDTFEISEKFEKVGFSKNQTKVVIEAIVSSRLNLEAVSQTKLREHKTEVKANIEKNESKVLQAIADLHKDTNQAISDLRKDTNRSIADLRKDNELLRKDMDAKFENLSLKLTVRLGNVVLALLKYLPRKS